PSRRHPLTLATRRACSASRTKRSRQSFALQSKPRRRKKTSSRVNSPKTSGRRKTAPWKSPSAILTSINSVARSFLRVRRADKTSPRPHTVSRFILLVSVAALSIPFALQSQTQKKGKLLQPRQLDKGVTWRRDPSTGELTFVPTAGDPDEDGKAAEPRPGVIGRAMVRLVLEACSVVNSDGSGIKGLKLEDFRVYDDGVERPLMFFSAPSSEPARVAMVIDASPSVFPDSVQMRAAESALVDALAPHDEVAVVDFAAHTFLQIGFSSDRELLHRAIGRVDVRELLGDTGGSNI